MYFNARRVGILILNFICILKFLCSHILILVLFAFEFFRSYLKKLSNSVVSDEISAERYFNIPHFWFEGKILIFLLLLPFIFSFRFFTYFYYLFSNLFILLVFY